MTLGVWKMAFRKKNSVISTNIEKVDTIIGKGTVFQGTINANGTVRIEGEYKGEIRAKGDVIIGNDGRVEATVEARNVVVAGHLHGNIQAQGKVDLASTAKLYGDMRVKNLLIEEGAIFKGNCIMDREDQEKIISTLKQTAH